MADADTPWYVTLKNGLFNAGSHLLPYATPAAAASTLANGYISNAFAPADKATVNPLDKWLNNSILNTDIFTSSGSFDSAPTGGGLFSMAASTAASSMFTDSQKVAGSSHADSVGFTLPLWGKIGIICVALVGTALVIKGSFDE